MRAVVAKAMTENADADAIKINPSMRTAVVILNWNTENFLRDFLPPLLDSVKNTEGAEVIVADNASEDGSLHLIEHRFPNVKTIRFTKNLGFTGGYNAAFEELKETGRPEYLVLINSDIEVTENWLQPLIDWMDSHPECGACAPKLLSWYNRSQFEYAGAAGGYIDRYGYPFCRGRVMKHVDDDHGQYDDPSDVFWATGACLMVRADAFWSVGGLDKRFFAHMEEIDMCWRMQLEGWRITVVPDSVVYHVGGGTLPAESPFKLYLNFRNNLLMLENNLAKTFALSEFKKGASIRKAALTGARKATKRISFRKWLDRMSASVYLLTFRKKSMEAVIKAHKDAAAMSKAVTPSEIEEYLTRNIDKGQEVKGIYKKWIVSEALIKGKGISGSIKETDFINI